MRAAATGGGGAELGLNLYLRAMGNLADASGGIVDGLRRLDLAIFSRPGKVDSRLE